MLCATELKQLFVQYVPVVIHNRYIQDICPCISVFLFLTLWLNIAMQRLLTMRKCTPMFVIT